MLDTSSISMAEIETKNVTDVLSQNFKKNYAIYDIFQKTSMYNHAM